MTGFVIRRILWTIPVLWAVATITFFLMHAVPGGPFDREKELPPAALANLEKRYNLDKPLYVQYGLYLTNLAQGDLGLSFKNGREVRDIITEGLAVTAQLGVIAFLYATIVGITLGVVAALYHNRLPDYLCVFFATIGTAMPNFIIATFLVIIFSVQLGWLGVLGWGGPRFDIFDPLTWTNNFDPSAWDFRKVVLPVIALGTLSAAYIARVTRASVLEVLNQDYIRTARAKGLAEYVVVLRHTIKNAMVPILTVLGPIFAFLVTGSFIVERVFAINGVGYRFVNAVFQRDYGMIMGTTLFFAAVVAAANLVVDILYAVVDPRIRYR
ncbi:MAG: ABC transporter permease [Dehalococcoidia bacterium]|nr:ABC transporter permease [Dehalococcoidia bacterium]